MDNFLDALKIEIDREKNLLSYHMNQLLDAPTGSLKVTLTRDQPIYYWVFSEGSGADRRTKQVNISDDLDLINKLIRKELSGQIVEIITVNLPLMEDIAVQYLDIYSTLN